MYEPIFKILDGGGAAWRALYVYVKGRQLAHIGIQPDNGVKPTLFGGVGFAPKQYNFRVPLPTIRWKYPHGKVWLRAYKFSQEFWHGMDGRYGWGTKHREEMKQYRKEKG